MDKSPGPCSTGAGAAVARVTRSDSDAEARKCAHCYVGEDLLFTAHEKRALRVGLAWGIAQAPRLTVTLQVSGRQIILAAPPGAAQSVCHQPEIS